jgi:hypothetical protein
LNRRSFNWEKGAGKNNILLNKRTRNPLMAKDAPLLEFVPQSGLRIGCSADLNISN